MFKKRMDAINHNDNKHLVFIPLGMLILMTLVEL